MKRFFLISMPVLVLAWFCAFWILPRLTRMFKSQPQPVAAYPSPPPPLPSPPEVSEEFVDPPLVLLDWGGKPLKMHTGDGYGTVLVYQEPTPEQPAGEGPRYILAVEKTRTVIDTEDPAVFAAALKLCVPPGSALMRYSVCGGGTCHGIKAADEASWNQMLQDAGLTGDGDVRITCTCP